MKKPAIHGIYLALIAALLFWNFNLKSQLADTMRAMAITEGVLTTDGDIMDKIAIYNKYDIDEQCNYYRTATNIDLQGKTNIFAASTDSILKTIQKSLNSINQWRNNPKLSKPMQVVRDLRSSIGEYMNHVKSIGFNIHDKELPKSDTTLSKLFTDDLFWEFNDNNSLLLSSNRLQILQNTIRHNEIFTLNIVRDYVSGHDMIVDQPRVAIAPRKATLIEGESIEADIYLTKYAITSNPNYVFKVNDKDLVIVNGVAKYKSPIQNPGKHTLKAQCNIRNPITGEIKTYVNSIEYEVLPKCSINCQ